MIEAWEVLELGVSTRCDRSDGLATFLHPKRNIIFLSFFLNSKDMDNASVIDEVAINLNKHSNQLRIKKFLFSIHTKTWTNDLEILSLIDLKEVIHDLRIKNSTLKKLSKTFYHAVNKLNKPLEYYLVARTVIQEMKKLYSEGKVLSKNPHPNQFFRVNSVGKSQGKICVLHINFDGVNQQFRGILKILDKNKGLQQQLITQLPSTLTILETYKDWQSLYQNLGNGSSLSNQTIKSAKALKGSQQFFLSAQALKDRLTQWYNSEEFNPIKQILLENLDEDEEIQLIVHSNNYHLLQLPWYTFFESFLSRYTKAEITISFIKNPQLLLNSFLKKVKILIFVSHPEAEEIELLQKKLSNIPDAEIWLLFEPTKEQFHQVLSGKNWNMLFFSSHNEEVDEVDEIYISRSETIGLLELKFTLVDAISRGLKLAVFNIADGLQLAQELASLPIRQLIVMRESMPNPIAQEFFVSFIKAFAGGQSCYTAVRQAREKLQSLEQVLPGVTWLPVICQTLDAFPLTWQDCKLLSTQPNPGQEQNGQNQELPKSSTVSVSESESSIPTQQPPPASYATVSYEEISLVNTFNSGSSEVYALALTPDGQTLISGCGDIFHEDDTIKIWNLATGSLVSTLKGHLHWVYAVAINVDTDTLVSGSFDGTIKIWSLATGKPKRADINNYERVNAVAITADGQKIISGSDDSKVKVWNLATGVLLDTLKGHTQGVNAVAITPDGQKIISGSSDKTIKVWNLATGVLLDTLKGHTQGVNAVAITPDGQKIISGSDDNTLKIWDCSSGTLLLNLDRHSKPVISVGISPDGEMIVSASLDKTIKIWDLDTGVLLTTLTEHKSPVLSVGITPDGKTIISGSQGEINIWRMPH